MKRISAALLALVFLLGLVACDGGTPSDTDGTETGDSTGVSAVYGEQKTLNIHTISQLNTTEYELDSAKGEEQYSSIVKNYRESYTLTPADLGGVHAFYPRLKKIDDSNYVLFYHDELYGGSVYCSRSTDCVTWTPPTKVFAQSTVVVDGNTDNLKYMTGDACVLDDGRIIAVSSFRAEFAYYTHEWENGVVVSYSSDNGKTWTEPEVVYTGTTWEPFVMQDDNGEIYIFFTCSAPSTYLYGFDNLSSGIGFVRSKDNGATWTPKVTDAPYTPQYVMRQYMGTNGAGIKIYNDQMPAALKLNNGTIALAAETHNVFTGAFRFSISYNTNRFADDLGMTKSGPTDRLTSKFDLAGPYLLQFDSGEVLLTYNGTNTFKYRLANCEAREFYDENVLLENVGCWGSCEKLSSHSAALSIGSNDYDIIVTKVYLNHTLNAKKLTPTLTANTSEWDASTDAIFLGSESQAQVAVRLAYDDDYVYLLAERTDRYINSGDAMNVFFYGVNGDQYIVNMTNTGYTVTTRNKDNKKETEVSASELGIKANAAIDGTVDSFLEFDNGIVYEIAIPRELVDHEGDIFYRVKMTEDDSKTIVEDSNPNASFMSTEGWAKARID